MLFSGDRLSVPTDSDFDDFVGNVEKQLPEYLDRAREVMVCINTQDVLANGMMHPDGFVKLQIGPEKYAQEGQVRLHVWMPGVKSVGSRIATHGICLVSNQW